MMPLLSIDPDKARFSRRLSDKILAAFNHACSEGDVVTATELLTTLEYVLLANPPPQDRREAVVAPLLEAHERLWSLKTGSRSVGPKARAPELPVALAARQGIIAASHSKMTA
jgi:hypothetical protein